MSRYPIDGFSSNLVQLTTRNAPNNKVELVLTTQRIEGRKVTDGNTLLQLRSAGRMGTSREMGKRRRKARSKHDYILDSIGDDYRRHIDVDIQIRKTGKRDDISRVGPLLPSNNQHYQVDRTGRASRAFSLTFMPARMRAVRFEI